MAFPENTINDTGIKHIWDKVTAALSGKVDKVAGKGLSTNDYTTAEKDKLAGIESGAQVNAVTSVAGKTGAVTLDKSDVGLGNVDNTSDASKPISTATQNALDTKADTSEVAGTQTATGNPITLTDASETYAQGLSVELEPKQDLHGQSAPYVGGAGDNIFDKDSAVYGFWQSNGTYSSSTDYKTIYCKVTPNTTYAVSGISGWDNWRLCYFNTENPATFTRRNINVSDTFTTDSDTILISFSPDATTYGSGDGVQVEKGNQATPFKPYSNICPISGYEGVEVTTADSDIDPTQSRTASVTFGQTVYGGSVDVTNGGTDEEFESVVFDGSNDEAWTKSLNAFYIALNELVKKISYTTDQIKCDKLKTISNFRSIVDGTELDSISAYSDTSYYVGQNWLYIGVSGVSTVKDLRPWLASNNIQVVYEKATPTTISTPPTDLKLLQDTNNITTNGTTISLDYIPNNSIGDAVKASEEYTDRAVERVAVAPKATLIDTWMISEESDTISVDLTSYDCNFFLFEYSFMSKRGTTLIPRPSGGSFSASVVTYNNGTALYIELDYNPTTKELAYTSNVTSQFGILAIYTI